MRNTNKTSSLSHSDSGIADLGPDKPIDQMNRLGDLTNFPPLVNAGATTNILLTLLVTWWLAPQYPQPYAPLLWIVFVLALNLTPVVFLRIVRFNTDPIPSLRTMDFIRDQHRFADWVYLAASANMAFWILLGWSVFSVAHTESALTVILGIAFVITFSPVLLRSVGSLFGSGLSGR